MCKPTQGQISDLRAPSPPEDTVLLDGPHYTRQVSANYYYNNQASMEREGYRLRSQSAHVPHGDPYMRNPRGEY